MANSRATSRKTTETKPNTKTIEATATKNSAAMAWYGNFCAAIGNRPLVGGIIAEFIGAFLLTAAFLEMQSGSTLYIAFTLAGVVFIVGGVTGAILNPAVTVGAWVTGKLKSLTSICYLAAQFVGAGAAWLVLKTFMDNSVANATASGATSTLFHAGAITDKSAWYLFFAELLGTIILSLGVAVAIRNRHNRTANALTQGFSILIALTITYILTQAYLTAQNTGLTFLNPAIAFAANGITWDWHVVIYLVAPIIGGIIGFVLRDILYPRVEDCGCDMCMK